MLRDGNVGQSEATDQDESKRSGELPVSIIRSANPVRSIDPTVYPKEVAFRRAFLCLGLAA